MSSNDTDHGSSRMPGVLNWIRILMVAAIYFAAAKMGLELATLHPNASPVWPPTGIALAVLLLKGYRFWPGIFLGAFLVNATTDVSFPASFGIAVGNTLEGLAGALLVNRYASGLNAFIRPQGILGFAVLAAMVSTMLSATFGVTSLCLDGSARWSQYGAIWFTWWMGDANGALIVAPLLILLMGPFPSASWTRARVLEGVLLAAGLLLVSGLVFGGWFLKDKHSPLSFMCLPILMWSAFRFSPRETAVTSFLLAATAVWGTLNDFGPFMRASPNNSLLLLQAFISVTSCVTLLFSALVTQEKRVRWEVESSRALLEKRVHLRTEELVRANAELTRQISERQRAEDELRGKTKELSQANSELRLFASAVSHELQEPLRKIMTFGEFIKSESALSAQESAQYVHKMQQAATRMQQLVADILELYRVTANARPLAEVDLGVVVSEVAGNFRPGVESERGSIEVGALPKVQADEIQMHRLFYNLLSNACKFRKKEGPVRVSIRAQEPEGGFVRVSVEDNGIGFDEQYLDKVFKPFQRLHPKNEYPGTGMGLAICERILLRHGGSITARSSPGKGAVFSVLLPV